MRDIYSSFLIFVLILFFIDSVYNYGLQRFTPAKYKAKIWHTYTYLLLNEEIFNGFFYTLFGSSNGKY